MMAWRVVDLTITQEKVFLEAIELARRKLARVLSCSLGSIEVTLGRGENGRVEPRFAVMLTPEERGGLTNAEIKDVVASVYWGVKQELAERLAHAGDRRETTKEESQEGTPKDDTEGVEVSADHHGGGSEGSPQEGAQAQDKDTSGVQDGVGVS